MRNLVHGLEVLPIANLLVEELVKIQAKHLRFLTDTQMHARDVLEKEQEDARYDERVSRDGSDLRKLLADLHAVAVDTTGSQGGTVESADLLIGEDAGEERTHHATDAMELENIEAFVDVQPVVEILQGSADHSCEEPDDCREPHGDVASSGCDADEASNSTLASANDGEATLGADVVDDDPANGTSRGGDIGVEGGIPIDRR